MTRTQAFRVSPRCPQRTICLGGCDKRGKAMGIQKPRVADICEQLIQSAGFCRKTHQPTALLDGEWLEPRLRLATHILYDHHILMASFARTKTRATTDMTLS